ncbi:MAG: hypothetical protein IAG10_06805 [Planctomycetaceae bacterium]|nr:hypothetical protein [Planctomycetaceae bacterium]
MLVKISRYFVVGAAVLIAIASLYVRRETSQANKQVDEANAASQAANALAEQVGPKYKDLFSETNIQGFPGNRDQYKATAQETVELLVKAAAQYRLAADKLEEASQQKVKKPLAEYWGLQVQSFRKLADSKEAFGNLVRLLLDESIQDTVALNEKVSPLIDRALALNEESDKFSAEAKKIQDQHKDVFK